MKRNQEKDTRTLLEKYTEIMDNSNLPETIPFDTTWKKTGDKYEQFSIYDYSKYTTATKASI